MPIYLIALSFVLLLAVAWLVRKNILIRRKLKEADYLIHRWNVIEKEDRLQKKKIKRNLNN
jgi:hypothetical protein